MLKPGLHIKKDSLTRTNLRIQMMRQSNVTRLIVNQSWVRLVRFKFSPRITRQSLLVRRQLLVNGGNDSNIKFGITPPHLPVSTRAQKAKAYPVPWDSVIPSQIGRKPALYLGELKMHQLRSASGLTMKYVTNQDESPQSGRTKSTSKPNLWVPGNMNSIQNLPPDLEILRQQKSNRWFSNASIISAQGIATWPWYIVRWSLRLTYPI